MEFIVLFVKCNKAIVGADAHIGPAVQSTYFHWILMKSLHDYERADVGIGPYNGIILIDKLDFDG